MVTGIHVLSVSITRTTCRKLLHKCAQKKGVQGVPPKAYLAETVLTDVVVAQKVGPDFGTLADCKESTAHHTSMFQVMTQVYIHSAM